MTKQSIVLEPTAREFLIDEIQNYFGKFGSMNKNDFEVLMFHVLLMNTTKDNSNFHLSRKLGIPETKVKRLRYEADLRYNQVSEEEYREAKIRQLNSLLTKAKMKKDGQHIEFVVEDMALRCFLDNALKEKNRFSDTSFNSEVVKIDINDLELLLDFSIENKELRKKILKEAEKLLKRKVEFVDLVPALLELAAGSASFISNATIPGLGQLIKSGSKTIIGLLKLK